MYCYYGMEYFKMCSLQDKLNTSLGSFSFEPTQVSVQDQDFSLYEKDLKHYHACNGEMLIH